MNPKSLNFQNEFTFKSSRSSGKGGQNVNKLETKIELDFDIPNSTLLSDYEKKKILHKLKNRIHKNGILKIKSQSERTQFLNKQKVVAKFYELIENALRKDKIRKETEPTKISKQQRLSDKKNVSLKKEFRKINQRDLND